MKKRMMKLFSMMAVSALCVGMFAGTAFAAGAGAGANGTGTTYTEANGTIAGTPIQFTKTLTMDTEAHVPNVQFFYTLSTPESIVRGENGTVDDYTNKTDEYTSAKVAVKNNDGTVKYTELYSGGDTTKVTGQPLFKTNTTSPASSTYVSSTEEHSGSVTGGTTGVVTFYSGGDGTDTAGKAGKHDSADAYNPTTYSTTTRTDSPDVKKYAAETATSTNLENTHSSGLADQGVNGNTSNASTTKDRINGNGNTSGTTSNKSEPSVGKKYAYANVELDFSGVTFNEPGVYRWAITETASDSSYTSKGITDDGDRTRILDVYVTDDGTGKLAVSGYIMHNEDENPQVPTETGADMTALNNTKPDGFANDYETENLRIQKTVTGNQASRNEYFKMTVTFTNMLPGEVCDVNLVPTAAGAGLMGGTAQTETNNTVAVDIVGADQTTDVTGVNKNQHVNPQKIVANDNGEVTAVFWLMHNQEIQISGISKNATYKVCEDAIEMDKEGYVPTVEITGDTEGAAETCNYSASGSTYEATDTGITADSKVKFTNTRKGTIPTGIIFAAIPGAIAAAAGGAGVVVSNRNRKREDEEE